MILFSGSKIISLLLLVLEILSDHVAASVKVPDYSKYPAVNDIQLIEGYASIDFNVFKHGTRKEVSTYLTGKGMNRLHKRFGTRMMFAAITNENLEAIEGMVDTPLGLSFDPDDEFCMTPLGYLQSMKTALTSNQLLILKKLKSSRMNQEGTMTCPVAKLTNESMIQYLAKMMNWKSLIDAAEQFDIHNITTTMKFEDGSSLIHHAILGNNLELVQELFNSSTDKGSITNAVWTVGKGTVDISNYTHSNPVSKTALMLAVSLNRVSIVKVLFETPVRIFSDHYKLRGLMRALPPKHRFKMLKVKNVDVTNVTCPPGCGDYLSAIKNKCGKDCYSKYSYMNTEITKNVLFAAIKYLDDVEMGIIIAESEAFYNHARQTTLESRKLWKNTEYSARNNIVSMAPKKDNLKITDNTTEDSITNDIDIYYLAWEALKRDKTSSVETLVKKLKILHQNGLEFSYIRDNMTSFYTDYLNDSSKLKADNPNLVKAVLISGLAENILESSTQCRPLINAAIAWEDADLIKLFTRYSGDYHFATQGLTVVPYEQTYLFMALLISWKNEDELVEVVKSLLKLIPHHINHPANFTNMDFRSSLNYSKADPTKRISFKRTIGWSPLMFAAARRANKVFKLLIDYGADPDYVTPLGVSLKDIVDRRKTIESGCTDLVPTIELDLMKYRLNGSPGRIENILITESHNKIL